MTDVLLLVWLGFAALMFLVIGLMLTTERMMTMREIPMLLALCLAWPTGIFWIIASLGGEEHDQD